MERIIGETIFLRGLETGDLKHILSIENNEFFWDISETKEPFSTQMIKDYLAYAHRDIKEVKQLRLAICDKGSEQIIGLLDLFDFDEQNLRAGVGILIENSTNRRKGYGTEALGLLINYTRQELGLHQLYANIFDDNLPSLRLFEKQGFQKIGVKKEWRKVAGVFKNEVLYQHIL